MAEVDEEINQYLPRIVMQADTNILGRRCHLCGGTEEVAILQPWSAADVIDTVVLCRKCRANHHPEKWPSEVFLKIEENAPFAGAMRLADDYKGSIGIG